MYRTLIEIKEDTPTETLEEIKEICIEAHRNRAGEVELKSIGDYSFAFEGEEEDYGCLMLANLNLDKSDFFKDKVKLWFWEDEELEESCDILKEFSRPIFV